MKEVSTVRAGKSFLPYPTITSLLMSSDIQSHWLRSVDQHAPGRVTKILIGNKSDLNEKRVVSRRGGEKLADELGIPFFEVSAKNNLELGKAFHTMTLLIIKKLMKIAELDHSQSGGVADANVDSRLHYMRNLPGLLAPLRNQFNRALVDRNDNTMTQNSKTDGQYPYRKLDSDTSEIRLLYLDGSSSKDDPLTCFVEYISLIDPGTYTALSYC